MEKGKSGKSILLQILNNFEIYIGTVLFIIIMFLLFLQVVSRFVFRHSFTWTEELAVALSVGMVYCGVSGAVTYRKHLRIDALLEAVPFKAKKALLIISDLIFIGFNFYVAYLYTTIIKNLRMSATSLLRIPKRYLYAIIPVMLAVTSVRIVFDILKLIKETPQTLGASKPVIDTDALEAEAKLIAAGKAQGANESSEAPDAACTSDKKDKEENR